MDHQRRRGGCVPLMGNANTPHSRALRAKTAAARTRTVVEAGGWRLALLLQPDAAAALRAEMARTGESATAVISRLLADAAAHPSH